MANASSVLNIFFAGSRRAGTASKLCHISDINRFVDINIPFGIIPGPSTSTAFLVCGDGSMALIEDEHVDRSPEAEISPDTIPLYEGALKDALAFGPLLASIGAYSSTGLSAPCPVLDEDRPKSLHANIYRHIHRRHGDQENPFISREGITLLKRSGADPNRLLDAVRKATSHFEDPLVGDIVLGSLWGGRYPIIEEQTSWGPENALACREIIELATATDSRIAAGAYITLKSSGPDGPAFVEFVSPDGMPPEVEERIADRILDILRLALDVGKMKGVTYEIGYGHSSRRNSYQATNPTICEHTTGAITSHQRVSSISRLSKILSSSGTSNERIRSALSI